MTLKNAGFIDSQLDMELGNVNIVKIIKFLRHVEKCMSICTKCIVRNLDIYGIKA